MKKLSPVRMTSSYFLKLKSHPGFHVIFPSQEDRYADAGVDVGSVVSVKTYKEADYNRVVKGDKSADQKYLYEYFCSVESKKLCRLSRLEIHELETSLAFSWESLPEAVSFQEYIINNPTKLLDLMISIYYIEFPQYDLSALNVYFTDAKGTTGSEFPN